MKKGIIIIVSIVAFVALFLLAFNGLAKHIFNRTDCERFNIDNIEVRTGVNVPKVDSYDCSCSDFVKQASFILDSKLDLVEYIEKNRFEEVNGIYQKQNNNQYTNWRAKLNTESRELSFSIEYLDQKEKSEN